MKMNIVVGTTLLQYVLYGERKNPAVICLHGWRSEGAVWHDIAVLLARDGYSVYALDLPGFGGSPAPKTPFTVSLYADIVSGFMKKMNIKKTILVGHSFGGRIAIKLSATKPELVSKLVLVDSAGFADTKKQHVKMLAKLVKPLFAPACMQGLRKTIYAMIGAQDYLETPVLQQTFTYVVQEDLSGDLPHIQAPTLLLWGKQDTDTPVSYGETMHTMIKKSQLVVFPGAGHFSFLDTPKEWYRALSDFLK